MSALRRFRLFDEKHSINFYDRDVERAASVGVGVLCMPQSTHIAVETFDFSFLAYALKDNFRLM